MRPDTFQRGVTDLSLPPLSFLVAESEPPDARARRRDSVGRSSGETYAALLTTIAPDARVTRITPADDDVDRPTADEIAAHDAVFLTGSPLHLYDDSPECQRIVAFMHDVFGSGVPAFGSCAGLQVAAVAAGGRVRAMGERREAGFARRITPTAAGRDHPLLRGRPAAFDAPAIHTDEVAELPDGATLLAGNAVTAIQAAEIRHGQGIFWGVQYHPEIDLGEIASALRRQAEDLVEHGLARDEDDVTTQAALIEALGDTPDRTDLAWRLGLDGQVTDPAARSTEIRNFIEQLVLPVRARRRG